MAQQGARTIRDDKRWKERDKDQEIIDNMKAVIKGKLLKDVPEELRTDEICYFATEVAGEIDVAATKRGEKPKYTTFASTVRPFIPDDVLYTGFNYGNFGHQYPGSLQRKAFTLRDDWKNRERKEITDAIEHVKEGKPLKDVPEKWRTDEVCYYATGFAGEKDIAATKRGEDIKYTTFASTVRPFIPDDVLFTGFLMGNVGHVLWEKHKAEEKARAKNLQESIIDYNRKYPTGKKQKL
jgi:DNA helicase IV